MLSAPTHLFLFLAGNTKESPLRNQEEPDCAYRLTAVPCLAMAAIVTDRVTTLSIGARAGLDLGGFPVDRGGGGWVHF